MEKKKEEDRREAEDILYIQVKTIQGQRGSSMQRKESKGLWTKESSK